MHIVELQRKLQEAQGKDNNNERIRPYSASVRCQKDIENLSRVGLNDSEISHVIDLPLTFIQRQKQRIWKANEDRRRFLATGRIPQQQENPPGVFTIFQR